MAKYKTFSIDQAMELFSELAKNEYSIIPDFIDDFYVNGHYISLHSGYFNSIVIDNIIHRLAGSYVIYDNNVEYSPLDYIKHILSK